MKKGNQLVSLLFRAQLRFVLIVGIIGGIALISFVAMRLFSEDGNDRQAEVADRGAAVMPFDLDRTLHNFQQREDGGLQTVTVRDPNDREQITLIREHLEFEAQRFQAGDFTDPSQIHGEEMPGLSELRAGAGRIAVAFLERPDGAAIRYVTSDPKLVSAIHDWFEAQTSDHGHHAVQH